MYTNTQEARSTASHRVESELDAIRRELRIWRIAGGLFCATLFLCLLLGAKPQSKADSTVTTSEARVRSLHVVNADGDTIFSVEPDVTGGGVMRLFTRDGKQLFFVGLGDFAQTGLCLYSLDGRPIACLGENENRGGQLQLFSEEAYPFLMGRISSAGEGQLLLSEKGGDYVRCLTMSSDRKINRQEVAQ